MKQVTDNFRRVPDINFDEVSEAVFQLLWTGRALRAVHMIWPEVDEFQNPSPNERMVVSEDNPQRWFRSGFWGKSSGSHYKLDLQAWYPEEVFQ